MNFETFISHLQAHGGLPKTLENELLSRCEHFTVAERSLMIEPGQHSKYIHFVNTGLFRKFRKIEGEEETMGFTGANEFIGTGQNFQDRKLSEIGVMCHLKGHGVKIKQLDWQLLCEENAIFIELSKNILHQKLIKMESESIIYRRADTKYKLYQLSKLYPGIMEVVARKHIGSYFGVTEQAISNLIYRMRKYS
jgi:CRP-like cAMP-binding protein